MVASKGKLIYQGGTEFPSKTLPAVSFDNEKKLSVLDQSSRTGPRPR